MAQQLSHSPSPTCLLTMTLPHSLHVPTQPCVSIVQARRGSPFTTPVISSTTPLVSTNAPIMSFGDYCTRVYSTIIIFSESFLWIRLSNLKRNVYLCIMCVILKQADSYLEEINHVKSISPGFFRLKEDTVPACWHVLSWQWGGKALPQHSQACKKENVSTTHFQFAGLSLLRHINQLTLTDRSRMQKRPRQVIEAVPAWLFRILELL